MNINKTWQVLVPLIIHIMQKDIIMVNIRVYPDEYSSKLLDLTDVDPCCLTYYKPKIIVDCFDVHLPMVLRHVSKSQPSSDRRLVGPRVQIWVPLAPNILYIKETS